MKKKAPNTLRCYSLPLVWLFVVANANWVTLVVWAEFFIFGFCNGTQLTCPQSRPFLLCAPATVSKSDAQQNLSQLSSPFLFPVRQSPPRMANKTWAILTRCYVLDVLLKRKQNLSHNASPPSKRYRSSDIVSCRFHCRAVG